MNFNYVSFESIIILHEIYMIIVTHPTTCSQLSIVSGFSFLLGHIVKAFQNNFAFIISTETCFWLKRVSDRTLALLSSFPRVETRFNTHYQNAFANAFRNAFLELLCLSSISQYREYESRGRLCHCGAAMRNFIRNTMHLKAFQNTLRLSPLQKRVSGSNAYQIALFSAFQKGVSNPLIKTALRLSSAKITLKVVWKP